jgi:hypothetical protein
MTHPVLDRLVSAGHLKAEPRNLADIQRMLALARTRLQDAGLRALSVEERFTSAYDAVRAVARVRR